MAHPVDRARDEWLKKGKIKGGAHSKSDDARKARAAYKKMHGSIPPGKVIAHQNDNPEDNSRGNLQAMSRGAHNSVTKKGKSLGQQAKGVKNKPNKPVKQRRFR